MTRRSENATAAQIERAEEELIQRGRDALTRIKQTFDAWMEVARAINVGRRQAMQVAGVDDPDDRGYQKEFGRWLAAHPPFDDEKILPKATRHWLFRCLEYEGEIVAWRHGKDDELTRYNYPKQVFHRWASRCRPELLTEKQRRNAGQQAQRAERIDESIARLAEGVEATVEAAATNRNQFYDLSSDELISESAKNFIEFYGGSTDRNKAVIQFADELKRQVSAQKRKKAPATAVRQAKEKVHGSDVPVA